MKTELNKIINECNSKRSKIYYKLNQLLTLTGLSPRMLKYKMKAIKEKYSYMPSLLQKVGREWQIHVSIINEFMPIRNHKNRPQKINWQCFGTWNLKNDYDVKYHIELINQLQKVINPFSLKYTIEKDGRGINHVHFLSDLNKNDMVKAVESVLIKFLHPKEFYTQINHINNKFSAFRYLGKAPLTTDII